MAPPVLLTGGTGFLGAVLARQLDAAGHPLHVLARASSPREALAELGVRWHAGELRDAESLRRAVAAVCDGAQEPPWVVHAGAVISYRTRDRGLQRAVNVGGTRHVLDACAQHPVGRLLHVSSVVAVGHARPREVLDEDAPWNGAQVHCDYVDTKRAAEELALARSDALDVVVVNPGAIFGAAGRESNTVRFLRKLQAGRMLLAPPGALSVVGVEDVARGCRLALERGRRGRRYLLVESAHECLDLFTLAARELGARAPLGRVPRPLWTLVDLAARAVDAVFPQDLFTPQALRMLALRFAFRADRARAELGWTPHPFPEVLAATIAGLRENGLLA